MAITCDQCGCRSPIGTSGDEGVYCSVGCRRQAEGTTPDWMGE